MPGTPEADISAVFLAQADRLFGRHAPEQVGPDQGWNEELWQAVEAAGFPLALVTEEAGGAGLSMLDVARLLRRSAYHNAALPLGETAIAAALWTAAGGSLVPGAITLAPGQSPDRLAVSRADGKFVVNGTARRVPWGSVAGSILVFACDEKGRGHLALVDADAASLTRKTVRNLAGEPRDTLAFSGVVVDDDRLRRAPEILDEAGLRPYGAFLRAQQMVGGMERCLDHALGYANERQQFGRPLAKFQAVQHMLAVAAGHFAAASALADAAAESYGTADFALDTALAKARCGEAAGKVAEICHQVHGAMGFAQEHPLHRASLRLWSWREEFGGEAEWQEYVGRLVCRNGGDQLWPMLARR
ncbi:MAG: acyl-CoA dehydrogenase family protein [Reyranellaceae bacterium]